MTDAFMKMMEQDAKERYERKKRDEKLAMQQKDLGNEEFKKGNYHHAVEYYSEVSWIHYQNAIASQDFGSFSESEHICFWLCTAFITACACMCFADRVICFHAY